MARGRRYDAAMLVGVMRHPLSVLLVSTALQATSILAFTAVLANAQPAPTARPMGGNVVAGSAAISRTANNTRIDQSSQRAAIDWRSFDIGSQQHLRPALGQRGGTEPCHRT